MSELSIRVRISADNYNSGTLYEAAAELERLELLKSTVEKYLRLAGSGYLGSEYFELKKLVSDGYEKAFGKAYDHHSQI